MKNIELYVGEDSTKLLIKELNKKLYDDSNKILYIIPNEQRATRAYYDLIKPFVYTDKTKFLELNDKIQNNVKFFLLLNKEEINFLKDINVLDEEFRDIIKNNVFVLEDYNNYKNTDTDNLIKNIIDFSNKYNIQFLIGYNKKIKEKLPKSILNFEKEIDIVYE